MLNWPTFWQVLFSKFTKKFFVSYIMNRTNFLNYHDEIIKTII